MRPNAPVSLLVTFEHRPSTLKSTTVYSRGSENKDLQIHDIIVTMQFFVRAAALRNGTFHVLLSCRNSSCRRLKTMAKYVCGLWRL